MDIRKANTLDEALNSYFSREQLDNNDYKCEACKRRVPATKQFTLERPPKVLCVQLKRFSVLGGKISKHIGFKPTIDMGPYLWREFGESSKQLTYKLVSIVTHMGPSPNCGHYTAVAQVSSGQYYSFDDSYVRPITLNNVLNIHAYIMIFEMENNSQNQQTTKLNGTASAMNISTALSSSTNKSFGSKASAGCSVNGSLNELSNNIDDDSSKPTLIGPQLPQQKSIELSLPLEKFTVNHLPQKIHDKSYIKNGKISNGNSLVPYDSSEEEDSYPSGIGSSKNQTSNALVRINATNGVPNSSLLKDASKIINCKERTNIKINTNGVSAVTTQATVTQCTKSQNGSNNTNGRVSLPKHQNGKLETKSQSERDKNTWRVQCIRTKDVQEENVSTKASAKTWQVSKDTSSAFSGVATNGWSLSDAK